MDQALESLKQARDLGIHGADQSSRAGYILLNVGHYEEAEKMFDDAVSDPASGVYYQSLAARGAVRYRLGRRAEGISDILAAKT